MISILLEKKQIQLKFTLNNFLTQTFNLEYKSFKNGFPTMRSVKHFKIFPFIIIIIILKKLLSLFLIEKKKSANHCLIFIAKG